MSGFQPQLLLLAATLLLGPAAVLTADRTKVLGPSGEVLIAPSANRLEQVQSPQLAPAPGVSKQQQVQADCLTEAGTFYGSDFLSTKQINASSPSDCCAACKLANDCTVWNWCGGEEGCPLPPNMATAGNRTSLDFQTCIWKPRPLEYGGTLPLPPTLNNSNAMSGWTSGIPINSTLLPALQGFEMTPGIEMEYNEDTDFFCTGSSTSKPVCQLYGNAKGGALACVNNPICRGFEICWSFPTGSDYYAQQGIVRLKAGAEAPLNIIGAIQNPYCSVYVSKTGAASSPNAGDSGYSIRAASNITALSAAAQKIIGGRKLLQAASRSSRVVGSPLGAADIPSIINIAPSQTQAAAQRSGTAPGGALPASTRPTNPVGLNFSTPYLQGSILQAFNNFTFNYSECYSDSPSIRVTLQNQAVRDDFPDKVYQAYFEFPLRGPTTAYSIHTWTEVPFRNSGDVCCAFQDVNDFFLDLETGVLAKSLPTYVATDQSLTTGNGRGSVSCVEAALRNYETRPASIVQPLVFIPAGQMNSPSGQGRQFTFPRINSSDYSSALELLHFSLTQTALGNRFCTPGFSQLASAVNVVGDLLAGISEDGIETSGGLPLDLQFVAASQTNPDGSAENASCLVERAVEYEGDVLQTISNQNSTVESCCLACWQYFDVASSVECHVWVLDESSGSCQLKNSTLAAEFQAVPAQRGAAAGSLVSGRKTAILPSNATNVFVDSRV